MLLPVVLVVLQEMVVVQGLVPVPLLQQPATMPQTGALEIMLPKPAVTVGTAAFLLFTLRKTASSLR